MNMERNNKGKFVRCHLLKNIECLNCKKIFIPKRYKQCKQKFCSNICRIQYKKDNTKFRSCLICQKLTRNKKYCSEECQYKGYSNKGEKIKKICLFCKKEFIVMKCKSFKQFCSRKCSGENKKITYLGENNPCYGRIISTSEKKIRSEAATKMWKNPIIRNKIKQSLYDFQWNNGYWPGSDIVSRQKSRDTLMDLYGVDHIWKIKEIYKKSNETCIIRYGKTSQQLMIEALRLCKYTRIEKIIKNILLKNNISFIEKFPILYKNSYREYDFYLPQKELLIEADGDFWHGNPNKYSENILLECQKANMDNDIIKNNLAKENNKKIIRFWESDIIQNNFEKKFLEKIYENVTITEKNKS